MFKHLANLALNNGRLILRTCVLFEGTFIKYQI